MSTETPRDAEGTKLCAWCGGQIKQSGVGRSRGYCSRTHREYAYRARREEALKLRAYSKGRADERSFSSTDVTRSRPDTSVDEIKPAGQTPVSAEADDYVLAPPAPSVRPQPVPTQDRQSSDPPAHSTLVGFGFGVSRPERKAPEEGQPDAQPTTDPR